MSLMAAVQPEPWLRSLIINNNVVNKYINKMDLQEVEWRGMDYTGPDQARDRWRALVSAVMNLRVP
jgi:hypothetical protein